MLFYLSEIIALTVIIAFIGFSSWGVCFWFGKVWEFLIVCFWHICVFVYWTLLDKLL